MKDACLAAFLALVCLGAFPTILIGQFSGTVLYVRVTEADREEPIYQVQVELTRFYGGTFLAGFTDSSGRYQFASVPDGTYIVIARKEGYRVAEERIDVRDIPVHVNLRLSRDPDAPLPAATSPVPAQSLNVPKKARKEFEKGYRLLMEEKDPAGSAACFQRALQEYPDYLDAYYHLALAYAAQGKRAEAIQALEQALRINEQFAPGHFLVGKLYVQEKKYQQAEKALQRGMELDPTAWQGPFEAAFCYYHMGDKAKALEYARRAHDLPTAPPSTHLLLVDIYSNMGNEAEALRELEEFSRAAPDSPFMPQVKQRIAELRGRTP